MVEMFGLRSPVPVTTSASPRKNVGSDGMASEMCPAMMMQPPTKTDRRAPISLSAIHPPGSAARYTSEL